MPYAQLTSISSRIEDIVSADALAVGFVKSEESGYELVGAIDAITAIEKFFSVDPSMKFHFFNQLASQAKFLKSQ